MYHVSFPVRIIYIINANNLIFRAFHSIMTSSGGNLTLRKRAICGCKGTNFIDTKAVFVRKKLLDV